MEFRHPKDEPTDLETLSKKLTEAGIEHEYREHPAYVHERGVVDIIGYYPAGTHQILVGKGENRRVSIIRGAVSFGYFELYGIGFEADRFETEEEVINALKKRND